MDNSKKEKTRKLSVYEFFQILQIEWIIADLRVRIYPLETDKIYWNKVKEGKRRIIDNIAEKNMLPTIFVDDEMKRALEHKVYRDKGIPNFLYRDEENKQKQEPLDLIYYYIKGADVRFEYFGELKIGKIKSYIPPNTYCLIEYEDSKELKVELTEVTRIV